MISNELGVNIMSLQDTVRPHS